MKDIEKYVRLLEANKNLILTGAPGTGKTYLAKEIVKAMGAEEGFVQFHPSYDYTDFVEGLRPVSDGNGQIGFERKDGVFKEFCKRALGVTFTKISAKRSVNRISEEKAREAIYSLKRKINEDGPIEISSFRSSTVCKIGLNVNNSFVNLNIASQSPTGDKSLLAYLVNNKWVTNQTYVKVIGDYIRDNYITIDDYENEIEQERDVLLEDNITNRTKKFVFVIDEINRGEISKIFGELFYCIDPGYRGEKGRVKTQYQNLLEETDVFYDGFYIPNNVYIIGTMNDIDRGVECMDFAIRRRFAWTEITADDSIDMLNSLGAEAQVAVSRMKKLNKAISDIDGLGSAYHIGGAYFLKLKMYLGGNDPYRQLWDNHLKGVLFEYLRGSGQAEENMDILKQAYFGI